MKLLAAGAAVSTALLLAPSAHALTDNIRECERITCVSGVAGTETVEFKCGDAGLTIQSVKFASLGTPSGTCASEITTITDPSRFGMEADASCAAANVKKEVEDSCVGEASCKFTIDSLGEFGDAGITGATCPGATGQGDLQFTGLVECGEPFDVFQIAIALVIVLIGLGLGATIEIHMVKEIFREHKRALFIGAFCQFGFMPLLAFFFASVMDLDPRVQLGYILVGSCPGGVTSNLFTYWSRGSVALSITMSAFSTFCALFMMPFLIFVYVEGALGIDNDQLEVPFVDIFQALLLAVIPALLGLFIRNKKPEWARKVEIIGSSLGVVFILAALIIGILDNPDLFNPTVFPASWTSAVFYQPVGMALGYGTATLAKLPRPEKRAVSLETGIQNFVLAIAVVSLSFDGCDARIIQTFPLISTFFYLVNSVIALAVFRVPFSPLSFHKDSDEDKARSAVSQGAEKAAIDSLD